MRYNTPTAVALFLLSPLLALPYILLGIYRQERSAYLILSLFLGFLAWLQIPIADLYRHTMMAYNYYGKPISIVFEDTLFSDYIIPLIDWILVNNDIPYQYLRLFSVTESFYLMTIIFNYMVKNSTREYTQKEVFVRFLIMYFFFEFIRTTSGVRYGFALYQYIFAMYLLFNRKSYLLSCVFAFFAIKIHTSFVYFIPVSIILYCVCISRTIFLVMLVTLSTLSTIVILKYSYLLGIRADWYFSGGSDISGDAINKITLYGFILFIFVRIFLLPFVMLSFRYFADSPKWGRMFMVWVILLCIFITNLYMVTRITFVLSAIGIVLLLDIEKKNLQKNVVTLILLGGIMTTVFNTVNYRTIILNSRYQYIAMPAFIILQNQYDKQWILEHVNGNNMKNIN